MSLTGVPDWHAPLDVGGRTVYAAYDRPGQFFAAPVRWEAAGDETEPPFLIEVYQQDLGAQGLAEFGLLTLRFRAAFDLGDLAEPGIPGLPEARFDALPVDRGLVELTAPEDIALPPGIRTPYELETAALVSPAVIARLDGPTTDLVIGALRHGLATVGAVAQIAVSGVACRFPAVVTLDAGQWADRVRGLLDAAPDHSGVSVDALRSLVSSDLAAAGISTATWPDAGDREAFTDAVVDRLIGRVASLLPAPADAAGPYVRLQAIEGQLDFDLSEATIVPRFWSLAADPLGPLRSLSAEALEQIAIRRHQVPALGSGWHTLTFSPTLVTPTFGLSGQYVELTVPPALPDRPGKVRRVLALTAGTAGATTSVRIGPLEPLSYHWSLTTMLDSASGSDVVVSPPQTGDEHWTAVRPDDTGLRFIPLEATPALVAEAQVAVTVASVVDGLPWVVQGTLDRSRPAVLVVLPAAAADPTVSAVATTPDGRHVESAPVTCRQLRLDPFSFPGPGPRHLTVSLAPGSSDAVVELAGQDDVGEPTRHRTVALTRGFPSTTFDWYARSPFRLGVCWRLRGDDQWSDPTDEPLTLASPEPVEGSTELVGATTAAGEHP